MGLQGPARGLPRSLVHTHKKTRPDTLAHMYSMAAVLLGCEAGLGVARVLVGSESLSGLVLLQTLKGIPVASRLCLACLPGTGFPLEPLPSPEGGLNDPSLPGGDWSGSVPLLPAPLLTALWAAGPTRLAPGSGDPAAVREGNDT